MKYLILSFSLLGITPITLAMGGMKCEGVLKKQRVVLEWSTSRVDGNPRFGEYRVIIDAKEYILAPKNSQKKNKPNHKKSKIQVQETGYWLSDNNLYLRLLDKNAEHSILLLKHAEKKFKITGHAVDAYLRFGGLDKKDRIRMICTPTG